MGQILSQEGLETNPVMVKDFLNIDVKMVMEIADLINVSVFDRDALRKDEFEDIFGLGLGEAELFFEILKEKHPESGEEQADIYEAMSAMTILCNDTYETKCTYLFSIFDFNRNFELDKGEFKLTIGATMRSLSKLTGGLMVHEESIEDFAKSIFQKADLDMSGSIEMEELHGYMRKQSQIGDYLLRTTGNYFSQ
jgi:Ca2+-binding EF-hand superfamily protein